MATKFFNTSDGKPDDGTAVWIYTFKGQLNIACYNAELDLFLGVYPDRPDNGFVSGRAFTDKHGDCVVSKWACANIPDFTDSN